MFIINNKHHRAEREEKQQHRTDILLVLKPDYACAFTFHIRINGLLYIFSSSNTMLGYVMLLSALGGLYRPICYVMLVEYHLNWCCVYNICSINYTCKQHTLVLSPPSPSQSAWHGGLGCVVVWWWCKTTWFLQIPQHIHRFLIILPKPRRIRVNVERRWNQNKLYNNKTRDDVHNMSSYGHTDYNN